MKKLIIAAISIIAVCIAVNAFAAYAWGERGKNIDVNDCTRKYIFREENGFVVCCEEDEDEPFLVTEIRVRELTPLDRAMLKNGVEVVGARAMTRALEDYGS